MKRRYSLILVILFSMLGYSYAQKVAVIDVNSLLEGLDQYKRAQEELDKYASTWRQEISIEMDKVKSMYNKYQAEVVLLSDDQKKEREDAIVEKEQSVMEMQKLRFGPEGDLFKKRQELVKPLQDKVYGAIQTYSEDRGIDIVLDKSSSAGIIFLNAEYDKTEEVRKRL